MKSPLRHLHSIRIMMWRNAACEGSAAPRPRWHSPPLEPPLVISLPLEEGRFGREAMRSPLTDGQKETRWDSGAQKVSA